MLRKSLFGLVAAIILMGGWATPSFSEKNLLARAITFADLGYAKDETLQGVRAARDYDFRWPDAWDVQADGTLTLRFSHSPALRPNSSVAVDLNGTRLASVLLTAENADGGSLRVTLPGTLIARGYNNLRVEFFMGIRDDFCSDLDNPAVWATVHAASSLQFSYAPRPAEPNLHAFPLPFIDNSQLVTNTLTFVLPQSPSTDELSAMATLGAKLGQGAGGRALAVDVVTAAPDAKLDLPGHLIYVGAVNRLPVSGMTFPFIKGSGSGPLVDGKGNPLPAGTGVLWEQVSPSDKTALVLVVTGENDDGVLNAARTLASGSAAAQLNGPLGQVVQLPPTVPDDRPPSSARSLESLGYRDVTSQGSREQTLNYVFQLPTAWQIQDEAALNLHLAHSELLDANRSSLNVLLNDIPVGSILLNTKNATDGRVTFQLPARLFRTGENILSVRSNIQLERGRRTGTDCLDYDYREAWLVVYSDSQLNLPGSAAGFSAALSNYPRAFIKTANLSDFAFVVPPSPDRGTTRAIARMAARLGRHTDAEALFLRVWNTEELNGVRPLPVSQVIVGRPSQNAKISELRNLLPQPFKAGSDDPEPVASLAQIMPPQGSVGYIQSTLTAEDQPRLVVTGNSEEGILWAAEALSDPIQLGKLKGDLAVLSGKNVIAAAQVRTKALVLPPIVKPSAVSTVPQVPTWVLAAAAGLFGVTMLVLLISMWRALPRREGRSNRGLSSRE